jgi:hypothetical protein
MAIAQKSGARRSTPVFARAVWPGHLIPLGQERRFADQNLAGRVLGLSKGNISKVASGKAHHTGGYVFRFQEFPDLPGEEWRPLPHDVPPHLVERRKAKKS